MYNNGGWAYFDQPLQADRIYARNAVSSAGSFWAGGDQGGTQWWNNGGWWWTPNPVHSDGEVHGNTVTSNGVFSGGSFSVTGHIWTNGTVWPYTGVQCKQGDSGGWGGNRYYFYWDGNVQSWVDATFAGYIAMQSDYRIKKDLAPLPSMWERVKALRPISYTHRDFTPPVEVEERAKRGETRPFFPGDDIERWGFVAHELQETLIESAATGVKDADDTIQSPNSFTIIAALTRALQEAMERIEMLEAKTA
jgi:hypothetical protein